MPQIFLTYRLKPGVSRDQYEAWVRGTDYPTMRGLTRVKSFATHRTVRMLFSEQKPGVDYIEVFDIPDLDGFLANDVTSTPVQMLMGAFMQFVDNPQFIIAEAVV